MCEEQLVAWHAFASWLCPLPGEEASDEPSVLASLPSCHHLWPQLFSAKGFVWRLLPF